MQEDASDGAETTSFRGFKAERFTLIHAVGSSWVSLWLCSTQFSLQTRQMEESQVGTSLIVVTGERRSEIRRVSCQQSNSPLMSQTFHMVPPSHMPGSAGDAGVLGSILGSGRSPGAENDNSLQYSCLGNPVDRGAWWATIHGVTKSQT